MIKKVVKTENPAVKTKPKTALKKAEPVKAAPKTYSLVIEGLSKTQAEALLKFFQKEAKCSIQ